MCVIYLSDLFDGQFILNAVFTPTLNLLKHDSQ